jgi:hypothetical protein
MKLRNIALAAAALALPSAAIIAGSAPSGAVTTPVVFAGTLSGNLKGSITISPAITLSTPSTVPVKFTTHVTDSNLVASKGLTQKGVTITAAKGTSVVTAPVGTDCLTLQTTGLPSGVITTKYTTTGGTAAATKFKPGATTVTTNSTTGVITAVLGGTGTTTTGSFKNGTTGSAASTATLILDDTASMLATACSTGLSSIKFTGVHGASTFTFG